MSRPKKATIETVGKKSSEIPIELSVRFLEHFSEQLYSSPQKAFEELISNGWDAGASYVDVHVSDDLSSGNATMCVFDNGVSMDEGGLQDLWHIASSKKKDMPEQFGRSVIGKFGIGKLATYVLAEKLTYICKASDGVIRRVTMDYSTINHDDPKSAQLMSELSLDVFTVDEDQVAEVVKDIFGGSEILKLIQGNNLTADQISDSEDEFGGEKSKLVAPNSDTWTLVVLSNIKETGKELKLGILKRMLEAALPFGSEMIIRVNGEVLKSSKIDAPILKEWVIGPELGMDEIEMKSDAGTTDSEEDGEKIIKTIKLASGTSPVPYIEIPGVGRITGKIKLFQERISGTKSDEHGASNGFHINVLGRIVNQNDPSFGEENLSHAAWARFRMTVRADGLNKFITTNREQFRKQEPLKVFRAFLRKAFNIVRSAYDSDSNSVLSDGGDVLVQSLGVVSLNPLRNIVAESLRTNASIPSLIDQTGIEDKKGKLESWQKETDEKISAALSEVKYGEIDDDSFAKFRPVDNSIVINKEHPFVLEHSSKAEKDLLRTVAIVNVLSDFYALDVGVDQSLLESISNYRDQLMRFRAMRQRESGVHIAKILLATQHASSQSKQFEVAVSAALQHIGFEVEDIAKPGEPEGIARAYPMPTNKRATKEVPNPPLYSFCFDAKSTKHEVVQTNNTNLAGVVEHRERYKTNYSLVVAPDFADGAMSVRCEQQKITPITAKDLGRILELTFEYGAIPLVKFQEIFTKYDPSDVANWIVGLEAWLKEQRPFTIDMLIKVLEHLKGKIPDSLSASTIALQCREFLKVPNVTDEDVTTVIKGLAVLIPDLIGLDGDKVIVHTDAKRVANAIRKQLENLHDKTNS